MMKFIAALLFLVAVVQAASILQADSPTVIPGSYIVVLKDGSGVARRDAHIEKLKALISATNDSSTITHTYEIGSLVGFAATLSTDLLNIELADSDVAYIEADQVLRIDSVVTQADSTWGLARISGRDKVSTPYSYTYDSQGGLGVNVYVIDTGILATHVEFQNQSTSRVVAGYNAITTEPNVDLNGHGTHCAGTVGGKTYGVAKNVTLISVKVLSGSGSGSTSGVLGGVNYVTARYQSNRIPSIASMSLGGGASLTLDNAVKNSITAGIAYSIAAGNSYNLSACNYSPARVSESSAGITVGATNVSDYRAAYSNIGVCVTLFAPGSAVTSAWIGSNNTVINTISGTSMATPHVAGVLALKLGKSSTMTPAGLKSWITAQATANAVIDPGNGSPNLLLYSAAPVA